MLIYLQHHTAIILLFIGAIIFTAGCVLMRFDPFQEIESHYEGDF